VTAPAPVRRSRALVLAAVAFVLLVTVPGAMTLVAQGYRSESQRSTELAAQADRLTVRDVPGDVRLLPSSDGLVHVRTQAQHGVGVPSYVEESTGSGVLLSVDCPDALAIECAVDYTIEVPAAFEVRVQDGGGDVIAEGLTGPLSVDRHYGDTRLVDVSGPVSVRSGNGDIDAFALLSPAVRLDTGGGDVELDMVAAPTSADVRTGYGDLTITVPGDQPYRVSADAQLGEELLGIAVDPSSTHAITAHSGGGDVRILQSLTGPQRVPLPPQAPRDRPVPPAPPAPPVPPAAPVNAPR
jgi:putative adhesin